MTEHTVVQTEQAHTVEVSDGAIASQLAAHLADWEQFQADANTPYIVQWENTSSPYATVYSNTRYRYSLGPPTKAGNKPALSPIIPLGALTDPYVAEPLWGDPEGSTGWFRFLRTGVYRITTLWRLNPGAYDWTQIHPWPSLYQKVGDPPDDGFASWGSDMSPNNEFMHASLLGTNTNPTSAMVNVAWTVVVADLDPEDFDPYSVTYPYGLKGDPMLIPVGWDVQPFLGLYSRTAQFSAGTPLTIVSQGARIFRLA